MTRRLLARLRTAPGPLLADIIVGALIGATLLMALVVTP